jgi:hypothetical protein
MLEVMAIILGWNIYYSVETRIKYRELETEVFYGTYPSDSFPDDPRHKPPKAWWEYIFD